MANVTIDIASEFRGKPAFDKAGKSVSSLEKSVGKLGKQLLGVFAVSKVVAFGKASVKAFAADEAAAANLANTVKNLGLAFAAPSIESYVQQLQAASGVIDDQLRPAMQSLLTTTGSVVKSQELLAQAIDISRGSGVDLATVTQDLSNAYVGNTKGLKKYYLGLSQAQLKAMSFVDIQKKLNDQFSGASAAYLTTYAGKLEKLNTAYSNAKENIGKGILDGLTALGGEGATNIDTATSAMNDFSIKIGNAAYGLGILVGKLGGDGKSPKWLDKLTSIVTFGAGGAIFDKLSSIGAKATAKKNQGFSFFGSPMEETQKKRDAAAAAKAEAAAKKRAAELLKAQKLSTKAIKDQAALKKAQGVFDLQQIELVAALQGKLSDQEKLRAEAQLALLNGNEAVAKKLTDQILAAQDSTGNLSRFLSALPNAKNPFAYLDGYLDDLKGKIDSLYPKTPTPTAPSLVPMPTSNVTGEYLAQLQTNTTELARERGYQYGSGNSNTIVVQIDGKPIAAAIQDQALNGNATTINRAQGNFG